jgi:hypothetical protein
MAFAARFSDYAVGRWYPVQAGTAYVGSSHSAVTSTCHSFPYFTPNVTLGIDGLGMYIGGSGTPSTPAQVRLAIYTANTANGSYPDQLVYGTGLIVLNTGAGIGPETFTEVVLTANTYYWFCSKRDVAGSNTSTTVASVATTQRGGDWQIWQTTDTQTGNDDTYMPLAGGVSAGAGAFPSTFPAGAAPATGVLTAGVPFFRVSSVTVVG